MTQADATMLGILCLIKGEQDKDSIFRFVWFAISLACFAFGFLSAFGRVAGVGP